MLYSLIVWALICTPGNTLNVNFDSAIQNAFKKVPGGSVVMGAFSQQFNKDATCSDTGPADEAGFYSAKVKPCEIAKGSEPSADGKNAILFFGAYTVGGSTYYYLDPSKQSGLFLTKEFQNSFGAGLVDVFPEVAAVVPQALPVDGDAIIPTQTCYIISGEDDSPVEDEQEYVAEDKVYCKFSVSCNDLIRTCETGDNLVVRTREAAFVEAGSDPDTGTLPIMNDFVFIKGSGSTQLDCKAADTYLWYNNGVLVIDTEVQKYTYNHKGKDTVIQCISNKKNYVWNVFTVTSYTQSEKIDPVTSSISDGVAATFTCQMQGSRPFPSPVAVWYWQNKEKDAEEEIRSDSVSRTEFKSEDLDIPNFSYVKTLTYSDDGNFKCYLTNGMNSEAGVIAAWYSTDFAVVNRVLALVPTPVHWYEYNSTSHSDNKYHEGTVYYVKRDTVTFRCDVEKRLTNKIWWKIRDSFYRKDAENLKILTDPDSDTQVVEELWSAADALHDEELHNGYILNETISSINYFPDILEMTEFNVTCFLVELGDDAVTYATIVEKFETVEAYKMLTVKFYEMVLEPEVRGPLSFIQAEKADITMNCLNSGKPPPYIYWIFVSESTNTEANVTEELLAVIPKNKYTRYTIARLSDGKETLSIQALDEEDDEGTFTCYAFNRQNTEDDPDKGPTAEVIIEEKCAEGARFCFNSADRQTGVKSARLFLIAFTALLIYC